MSDVQITRAVKPEHLPKTEEGAAEKAAPRFLVSKKAPSYDLLHPMEWEGVEYHKVEFNRMRGRHFKNFGILLRAGVDETVVLISMICEIPVEVAKELDLDDHLNIAEQMRDFIPARFREKKPSGPASKSGPRTQG